MKFGNGNEVLFGPSSFELPQFWGSNELNLYTRFILLWKEGAG